VSRGPSAIAELLAFTDIIDYDRLKLS